MCGAFMNRPCHALGHPFDRSIEVAGVIGHKQVQVRALDRHCGDRPWRCLLTCIEHVDDHRDHLAAQSNRRMYHAFSGHAFAYRIAGMEHIWLDEADLVIPGRRP